nr:Rpn family recombination-promoting nuclease/putative transposase [uncultured Arsenicibacter sp.]
MAGQHLIRFDWAIKRLLRQKSNYVILEGFLSELLREDIRIEQILESESNQEAESDKFNRVDVLALNEKKELIIIEIQNNREQDYFQRMLYGVAKTTAEHIQLGQKYSDIKKVYSVNIVYFDLGQGEDYVYHGKTEFRGIHANDVLSLSAKQKELFSKEAVFQLFPEYYVLKVNRFNDVAKDKLDEWIYYLKNNEIRDDFRAKGLSEVRRKLMIDSLSERDRAVYYRHLDNSRLALSVLETARMEGKDEGIKEGLEEGRQKAQADMIRRMKNKGLDEQTIGELTGLSPDQIRALTGD